MIASFLKDEDGNFAIGGLAGAIVGASLTLMLLLWFLPRAIRTGRIPYGAGRYGSRTYWVERAEHPFWFWFLFVLYCCLIPLGIDITFRGCFGPEHGFL
jgi:hypothetical protein